MPQAAKTMQAARDGATNTALGSRQLHLQLRLQVFVLLTTGTCVTVWLPYCSEPVHVISHHLSLTGPCK
jgi:hypothetical protein